MPNPLTAPLTEQERDSLKRRRALLMRPEAIVHFTERAELARLIDDALAGDKDAIHDVRVLDRMAGEAEARQRLIGAIESLGVEVAIIAPCSCPTCRGEAN